MPEWIVCPQCNLKHRERPDGHCPRCKRPLAGAPPSDSPAPVAVDLAEDTTTPAEKQDPPWAVVIFGFLFFLAAFYLHVAFLELESGQRESVRLWWGLVILYKTFGATVTVALVAIIGAAVTISGVRRMFA